MWELEDEIIKIYFDKKQGFKTAQEIYKLIDAKSRKITLKQIKDVLKRIENNQTKPTEINKKFFITIVSNPDTYQADLTFYNQFKQKNSGFCILFNIININTRFLYCYPLKNKSAKWVNDVFVKFLSDVKTKPNIIECDKGSEFINKEFKDICNKNDIKLIIFDKSISPNWTSIVER